MTLGMAWLREAGDVRELVVASDSRLSGGYTWDGNPKIFLLPRSDAVISFSGHTGDAFPLIEQAINAIRLHKPASSRSMDLADLKGHLVRLFNHSRTFIGNLPVGVSEPDPSEAVFMLSGYSWKSQDFRIWKLHYDSNIKEFTFRPTTDWKGQAPGTRKRVAFVGDEAAVEDAKFKLTNLLQERGKISTNAFDMEPFEVLVNIIRGEEHSSVGGPPQLIKIYSHANAVPMGVYWPNKSQGQVCLFGRPLMDYEQYELGVFDPDSPSRAYPNR